jgi:hypothetical protein
MAQAYPLSVVITVDEYNMQFHRKALVSPWADKTIVEQTQKVNTIFHKTACFKTQLTCDLSVI